MTNFLLFHSWFIPFYGLIGAVTTLPWAIGLIKKTGPRPAAYINIFMTLLSFIHGSLAFEAIIGKEPQQFVWHWFQAADLDLTLSVELSPVSLGALGIVSLISLAAQIYALGYMEKDWSMARFYGLMGFFEAALVGLALSDSLLFSYGLLELLTLSTYLLVGFWYAQPLVVTAARDAFLTKRVGDILLLMGIVALSSYGEGLNFSELGSWAQNPGIKPFAATLLGLALMSGPVGKCAQFPLNLWLDEAMEGPNPAGIMRNSIVVSAGAYVLIKLQPIFTLSPVVYDTLIVLGTITTIGSSFMAIAQIDIKRTLSHSTSAYLGLVFIAVGLGDVDIAFLLLCSHAIAKALLFMSAGSVIWTTHGQNITEMGGLGKKMPLTASAFVMGSAGLLVVSPLGMFWTVQKWFNGAWDVPGWLVGIIVFVNIMSAINLVRTFRLVFLGPAQQKTRRAPEVPWPMALPMVSMIIMTTLTTFIPLKWQLWLSRYEPVAVGSDLSTSFDFYAVLLSGIVGVAIGATIYLNHQYTRSRNLYLRFLQDLFAYDFYIAQLYNLTVVWAVSNLAKLTNWLDRYVVDGFVNLITLATVLSGSTLKYNSSGQSQFYILTIFLGIVGLVWLAVSGYLPSF